LAGKVPGEITDTIEDPSELIGGATNKASKSAGDSSKQVNGVKDTLGGATDKASDSVGDTAGKATKSLEGITGLVGKTVDDSGNIVDESGKVLGKASGDLQSISGKKVNEAGEIVDEKTGDVLGKVSSVSQHGSKPGDVSVDQKDGQTVVKANTGEGGSGGIQISVNTTKDGISLTINIPGSFQQQ